ncbi:MAG: cytochrome c biogenesis protein CcsA [Actinomycetota bacterium]|nr:cytochrome c biogenesis protein CcsA [Actinomycetota bacterium]
MDAAGTHALIDDLVRSFASQTRPIEWILLAAAIALAVVAVVPATRARLSGAVALMALLLAGGEGALMWFHYRLYELAIVVSPDTGAITGRVAAPLWIESEKLYVWALVLACMLVLARRHRKELLPGGAFVLALLVAGAVLWSHPFTQPLPSFLGQYQGYLQATASGNVEATRAAFEGMEGARQFYYNTWYMWVHPPLLFLSYGAFVMSFVATVAMIRTRYSAFETTAYRWARFGYLPLTAGMLLGFPWAIMSWQGESWWWSGKVNMSIMMWLLYAALLHARLYLRRRGMWRLVAAVAVLSFVVLVLTYLATYIVPGAHSYALAPMPAKEVASWVAA